MIHQSIHLVIVVGYDLSRSGSEGCIFCSGELLESGQILMLTPSFLYLLAFSYGYHV
jgi:hypothetical protein